MGRLLVVDDQPTVLEVMGYVFDLIQVQTSCVLDGEKALERITAEEFNLIFTDCYMPNLNGWDLIKELKTSEEYDIYSSIPIIGMGTGFRNDNERRKEYEEKKWVVKFDFKPISNKRLYEYAKSYCSE